MITTLDEVMERLQENHDCKEDHCGCWVHLLMAEILEGWMHIDHIETLPGPDDCDPVPVVYVK